MRNLSVDRILDFDFPDQGGQRFGGDRHRLFGRVAETVRQLGATGAQRSSVLAVERRVEKRGRAEYGDDQCKMAIVIEDRCREGVDAG